MEFFPGFPQICGPHRGTPLIFPKTIILPKLAWAANQLSLDRMCTSVWAGTDPMEALKTAAAEWDATTENLGVDAQKGFYKEYLKLPGATAANTVEKLGMAVKL